MGDAELRAFMGWPIVIVGLIYVLAGTAMALAIPANALQHNWMEHLLFSQNGPASASITPFQTLPPFNATDDAAFAASIVIAAGALFLAMGLFGASLTVRRMIANFPRLGGVVVGYMIAVSLGDAIASRAEWVQLRHNGGGSVFIYIAAGAFMAEALRNATTTPFFRENYLTPLIDGLLTLWVVFLLSFRYDDNLLAAMGGAIMLTWLALWSYVYDFILRGVTAFMLAGRELDESIQQRFSESGPSLSLALSTLRAVFAQAGQRYFEPDLYREFDEEFVEELELTPQADAQPLESIGFWVNLVWFLVVIPGVFVAYWLAFHAR